MDATRNLCNSWKAERRRAPDRCHSLCRPSGSAILARGSTLLGGVTGGEQHCGLDPMSMRRAVPTTSSPFSDGCELEIGGCHGIIRDRSSETVAKLSQNPIFDAVEMPRPLLIAMLAIALLALGCWVLTSSRFTSTTKSVGRQRGDVARDSIGCLPLWSADRILPLSRGIAKLARRGSADRTDYYDHAIHAVRHHHSSVRALCFPNLLTSTERWVLAGLLVINPILWMSSTYGNSAMPSAALLVVAVAILSNWPRPALEAGALALYGAAILVRADAVLAFPLVVLLLHLRYREIRVTLTRTAPLVIVLAVVYGFLFLTDTHMATALEGVKGHLTSPAFETRFWDYLLWSTSPLILAFAVVGVRELLAARRQLMACVAGGACRFLRSTTAPRPRRATLYPRRCL